MTITVTMTMRKIELQCYQERDGLAKSKVCEKEAAIDRAIIYGGIGHIIGVRH